MPERALRERLAETVSNYNEDTIIIIWCSKFKAYQSQKKITDDYLNFVRECSSERRIKEVGLPDNFTFLAKPPTMTISIGATVEALKNSNTFFEEIVQFCESNNLSYIQIL